MAVIPGGRMRAPTSRAAIFFAAFSLIATSSAGPIARSSSEFPTGLGSARTALDAARAQWQDDACLSRVTFKRRIESKGGPLRDLYEFLFYSKSDWKQTFRYMVWDHGADEAEIGRKEGRETCIGKVNLDIKAAIERATRAGLKADYSGDGVWVVLEEIPSATIASGMRRMGGGDRKALLSVPDRTVWYVRSADTGAVIDAVDGKVYLFGATSDIGL